MYFLPLPIIQKIYEFDPTYHERFKGQVMHGIRQEYRKLYKTIMDDVLYDYHEERTQMCEHSVSDFIAFSLTPHQISRLAFFFYQCDCCDQHQRDKSTVVDGICSTKNNFSESVCPVDNAWEYQYDWEHDYDAVNKEYDCCECACRVLCQYLTNAYSKKKINKTKRKSLN